jgi:hypothetical protein
MILPVRSRPISTCPENSTVVLFVEPAQEFLEPRVRQNLFHGVECVAQFVVAPGLVDKVLARVAGRHDLPAAFAARHYMMTARGNFTFTENAGLRHKELFWLRAGA